MDNPPLMDKIKQENIDIEIKPDIRCFEFLKAEESDGNEEVNNEDSVLSNETNKTVGSVIHLKEDADEIHQSNVMEFSEDSEEETDNNW